MVKGGETYIKEKGGEWIKGKTVQEGKQANQALAENTIRPRAARRNEPPQSTPSPAPPAGRALTPLNQGVALKKMIKTGRRCAWKKQKALRGKQAGL